MRKALHPGIQRDVMIANSIQHLRKYQIDQQLNINQLCQEFTIGASIVAYDHSLEYENKNMPFQQ